jgi:hypothetical protein
LFSNAALSAGPRGDQKTAKTASDYSIKRPARGESTTFLDKIRRLGLDDGPERPSA